MLSSRLSRLFQKDVHSKNQGNYLVNSLYFDSPYDKALREKVDGIRDREKFRLRYYDQDTHFIRLEKKEKRRGLCRKTSEVISYNEADCLLRGEMDFLLKSNRPLFVEFYSKIKGQRLEPKTYVKYTREAFVYHPGNVRITLDKELATTTNPTGFFEMGKKGMDVSQGRIVLEVKYDEFLPEIVSLALQGFSHSVTAYSKYVRTRWYE